MGGGTGGSDPAPPGNATRRKPGQHGDDAHDDHETEIEIEIHEPRDDREQPVQRIAVGDCRTRQCREQKAGGQHKGQTAPGRERAAEKTQETRDEGHPAREERQNGKRECETACDEPA